MKKLNTALKVFSSTTLLLGLVSFSSVSRANNEELSLDVERDLIESETVEAYDEHHHRQWICFARNNQREEFVGRGEHRFEAEQRAMEHCRRFTHHHHHHFCRIVGCNITH